LNPRFAGPYHRHRDTAQLRLRGRGQLAKIPFDCHPGHITQQPENATFLTLGLVLSGTQADADNLVTLCYVDDELVSYRTATLTAAYKYDLTYLRRGIYGTVINAHSA